MKCNDPSSWPEPSAEHVCEEAGHGTVRLRACSELHPKVQNHEGRGSPGLLPIVVGTLILVEVQRLPRGQRRREPRVLWLCGGPAKVSRISICSGDRTSGASTWSTLFASSSREHGMEHASGQASRAGRPVDVVGGGGFHPAEASAGVCSGPEAALGAPLRPVSPHAEAGTPHRFGAFGALGDARQAAETLRKIARKAPRTPLWAGEALPGRQEDHLKPHEVRKRRSFAMETKAIAKLPWLKHKLRSSV
jgi:hypothetical protein